jgi:hypothetical protein
MARVAPFHSINESRKGAPRYHTNDNCELALAIPPDDLRPGSGGFYVCERCLEMRSEEEEEQEEEAAPVVEDGAETVS